jgi:hypothetical protein
MPTHIANYSGVPLDINAWESTGGNNAGLFKQAMISWIPVGGLPTGWNNLIWSFSVNVGVSDTSKPEALLYQAPPARPFWLPIVQSRINSSIMPPGIAENDGCWLDREIADAANEFFVATAEFLPGEPYLDRTYVGDLVAEFKTGRGRLTAIVTLNFVLLFAGINGETIKKQVPRDGDIQKEVQYLTQLLTA